MSIVYDFSNSQNWQLGWSGEKIAPDVPNDSLNRYYPIEDFTVPVQFDTPVVAIYLESDTDPGRWIRGGFAKQKISTGITGGGGLDAFSQAVPLRLREINLVQFPQITTSYGITLSIPYWLRHIEVTVYQYVGTIVDTIEDKLIECCDELNADIEQVRQDIALSTTTILDAIGNSGGEGETEEQRITRERREITFAYFMRLL